MVQELVLGEQLLGRRGVEIGWARSTNVICYSIALNLYDLLCIFTQCPLSYVGFTYFTAF